MENTFMKNLKIIVILAFIITVIGAVLYLIYSFTIVWQAIAATIVALFLSLLVILFIILAVYLWIKILILRRELNTYKLELDRLKVELQKCKNKSDEIRNDEKFH
jgi:membrane protein implicated in regulation of membrane protease activity